DSASINGGTWFNFEPNGANCQGATTCNLDVDVPTLGMPVGVRCSPPAGATGSQTGTVTFTSNTHPLGDSMAPLTCPATPGPPRITVMTASVDFGDVGINPSPAPTKTVTIANDGDQDLIFTPSKSVDPFASFYTLAGCSPNCTVPSGMTAQ